MRKLPLVEVVDAPDGTSRRSLFRKALAAAAAVAGAGALFDFSKRTARAVNGDPLTIGNTDPSLPGPDTSSNTTQVDKDDLNAEPNLVLTNQNGGGIVSTGTIFGARGVGTAAGSVGVRGYSSAVRSAGVRGEGTTYGVMAESSAAGGAGVLGEGRAAGSTGVRGVGTIFGVVGESSAASSIGVQGLGTAADATGVRGVGTSLGVLGEGTAAGSVGVRGVNSAANGTGVSGSGASLGVVGESTAAGSVGVRGISSATDATGVRGDGSRAGVLGESSATSGAGVIGISRGGDGSAGVAGASRAGTGVRGEGNIGLAGISPGGLLGVFCDGKFAATGTKSAVVAHPDGSHRLLYCMESPECWFEDFGRGALVGGRASVALDPDFAAVVNTTDYHVFLTPQGDSKGLYVSSQSVTGFTVNEQQGGSSSLGFSYRVVARRKDVDAVRLAKFALPDPPTRS